MLVLTLCALSPSIGNNAIQLFAEKCRYLEDLGLGCPYRIRDDMLKGLVFQKFKNLKTVQKQRSYFICFLFVTVSHLSLL